MRKGLILTLIFVFILASFSFFVSAGIDTIHFPHNNDTISYSANVPLNISSTASTGCYFNYDNTYNQSIACDGVSQVNLPNADGSYLINVGDDGGSQVSINLSVVKPSGILVAFIYFLFCITFLGLIYFFIWNLAGLVTASTRLNDVAFSWNFYFLLLITYWLSLEYLSVPFVDSFLVLFMKVAAISNGLIPLIALMISMIVRGSKKIKPDNLLEQRRVFRNL